MLAVILLLTRAPAMGQRTVDPQMAISPRHHEERLLEQTGHLQRLSDGQVL